MLLCAWNRVPPAAALLIHTPTPRLTHRHITRVHSPRLSIGFVSVAAAKISERTPLLPSGAPPDASGSSDSSRSSSTGDSSGRLISPRARALPRTSAMSDAGTPLIRAEDRHPSSPTPGLASPSGVDHLDDGTRATSPRLQRVVGQFDGVGIHNIQQSVSPPDRGSELSQLVRDRSAMNDSAEFKNYASTLTLPHVYVHCACLYVRPLLPA